MESLPGIDPSRLGSAGVFPTRAIGACPLCRGSAAAPDFFCYSFEGAVLPAARCPDCGFVFLARQPTQEGFARLYDKAYFDSDYDCGLSSRSYFASEIQQRAEADRLLERLEREVPPGRILEVGCAGGFFLLAARERGWTPVGIELSEDAARAARVTLGLDVRTGTLEESDFEPGSFDAAYMGDALEHVPDPVGTLRRIGGLLRPGGAALIAVPVTLNALEWHARLPLYRMRRSPRVLELPPYHLVEFTPATLGVALGRAGLEVRWVRQSKIPPGWRKRKGRPLAVHLVKLLLDALNWFVTRLTGRFGDRALALARRPAEPPP